MIHEPRPSHSIRRLVAAAVVTAAGIGFGVGVTAGATTPPIPEPPDPALGHSQVIAQTVWDFDAGPHHWTVFDGRVHAGRPGLQDTAGFLLAPYGAVDASDGAGRVHLETGQAAYVHEDVEVSTDDPDGRDYRLIHLESGEVEQGGFDPGDTTRDVDLVADVLADGETLTIPDGDLPTLVVVTYGVASISSGGEPVDIGVGPPASFDGDVVISSVHGDTISIVALVIGPAMGEGTATATSTTETAPDELPTETSEPGNAELTVSFSPSNPARGSTIDVSGSGCEPGATVDLLTYGLDTDVSVQSSTTADADGNFSGPALLANELRPGDRFGVGAFCTPSGETVARRGYAFGTIGEAEGVTDFDVAVAIEPTQPAARGTVNVSGSGCAADGPVDIVFYAPGDRAGEPDTTVSAESDGRFATAVMLPGDFQPGDAFMVAAFCGEGRGYAEGTVAGSTPTAPPTAPPTVPPTPPTPPADTDSDGDGLSDSDEETGWFTDPNSADSDGDGLLDGEEVFTYGTGPWDSDSDFDGVDDGDEVSNNTDPLDSTSF